MKPDIVNSVIKHICWKPIYNRVFSTSTQVIRIEASKIAFPTDYAELALYRILNDV